MRLHLIKKSSETEACPTWPVPPAPVLPAKLKTYFHPNPVSPIRWGIPAIFLVTITMASEAAVHHIDPQGANQAQGFPEQTPKILAVAEKPVTLHFIGLPANWNPTVHIHRISSARLLELDPAEVKRSGDIWQITWTPPETRGPAQYLIRLEGKPDRTVRLESRNAKWLDATRKAIALADWQAHGLTSEERAALANLGIQTQSSEKSTTATLELRPRQGDASRRRIVWDAENPHLLVWKPGPAAGDLEARAPRWWISPESLATDHGLIRFLDLFSEPPLNP